MYPVGWVMASRRPRPMSWPKVKLSAPWRNPPLRSGAPGSHPAWLVPATISSCLSAKHCETLTPALGSGFLRAILSASQNDAANLAWPLSFADSPRIRVRRPPYPGLRPQTLSILVVSPRPRMPSGPRSDGGRHCISLRGGEYAGTADWKVGDMSTDREAWPLGKLLDPDASRPSW